LTELIVKRSTTCNCKYWKKYLEQKWGVPGTLTTTATRVTTGRFVLDGDWNFWWWSSWSWSWSWYRTSSGFQFDFVRWGRDRGRRQTICKNHVQQRVIKSIYSFLHFYFLLNRKCTCMVPMWFETKERPFLRIVCWVNERKSSWTFKRLFGCLWHDINDPWLGLSSNYCKFSLFV